MKETWVNLKRTNGNYQISNFGKLKSVKNGKEKITKGWIQNTGYRMISIDNKKISVHRLVAIHFIPPVHGKDFVNHIDGNKLNNRADNLEWCTCKENIQHAFRTGLMDNAIKLTAIRKIRAKIIGQFDCNGNFINKFKGSVEAQKYLNNLGIRVNARNIRNVCQGNRPKAGGYCWKYLEGD